MSADDYFDAHIPHRVNLLIAFRQRYSGRYPKTLGREEYRDLFRCAKDMSLLMVRFFCDEMGIRLPMGASDIAERGSPARFGCSKLSAAALRADPRFPELLEVLRAANRAVAHINEAEVDHAFKTDADDERIFRVINWVEDLVKRNIYQASGRDFTAAMSRPENDMHTS